MELKKFEAPTLAQALQVVKRELGPEAVIISTKNNKSGFGLMNNSSVEVTAAVAPEALERKRAAEKRMTSGQLEAMSTKPAQKIVKAYDILSGSRLARELEAAVNSKKSTSLNVSSPTQNQSSGMTASKSTAKVMTQRRYVDIEDDESPAELGSSHSVDRTRISAQAVASQQTRPAQTTTHQAMQSFRDQQAIAASQIATPSASKASNNLLPKMLAQLIDAGMDQELVRELGDELKIIMVREQISKEELLRHQLARVIMARLRVAKPLSERLRVPSTPRMFSFVGPTGVGKTTTIAKIAAELVINQRRPVTLATTDTFKIAAVEQLQTYANILRIPLEVCPSTESLGALAASLDPEHVVLIDTAGYGPRDERKLVELKETLAGVRTETHLCVGAMTRDRDLAELVRRFKIFEPDYLVMTKLDETSIFGGIFNICVKSHLPLSYFTMGQRVPEDMEIATKERVADLLLNISGGN